MPHSQGLSIICMLSPINTTPCTDIYFLNIYTIVLPYMSRSFQSLFPVGLPVNILKALLPPSILATCPAHLNLLNLITLTILGNGTNYEVPHCGAFSTPYSHPSWAQIFTSGSCFQIPLAGFPF